MNQNPLCGQTTVPSSTKALLPSMVHTARMTLFPGGVLTPQDLVQPMPSIIDSNPTDITPAAPCNPVSQWVQGNPFMAVGVLLLLAYAVGGHHK